MERGGNCGVADGGGELCGGCAAARECGGASAAGCAAQQCECGGAVFGSE